METKQKLSFSNDNTTLKEAKRKASIAFNKQVKPIDEFNYTTSSGTYLFIRRNIVTPGGYTELGVWK